jgi:transposase-like protein
MTAPNINTQSDLPPGDTVRWSPHRKASVVNGVRSGAISLDEACRRYQLSAGEFRAWREALEVHGIGALRVTRVQLYRDAPTRQ